MRTAREPPTRTRSTSKQSANIADGSICRQSAITAGCRMPPRMFLPAGQKTKGSTRGKATWRWPRWMRISLIVLDKVRNEDHSGLALFRGGKVKPRFGESEIHGSRAVRGCQPGDAP